MTRHGLHSFSMNLRRCEGSLLSKIFPFAGSCLMGYAIGLALKKVLKLMSIIVGFLAQALGPMAPAAIASLSLPAG